jgi:hypothetical protein
MTKQPNRIKVKETERYWGDFEGTLTEIITSLQNAIDDGWEGIESNYEPYEDFSTPYLYKHREENDKEYAKRMKELEKQKEEKLNQKEKRRQEYERLKKEFEDTP